jgi:hypothetical protein
MKEKIRKLKPKFVILALSMASLLFYNCNEDEDFQDLHNHVNGTKSRLIKGEEADKIGIDLFNKLSKTNKSGTISKNNQTMSLSGLGNVNYDEILEVIEALGEKNYTFRIENHPEQNEKTFFNLVYNNKENKSKIFVQRYEMNDASLRDYKQTGKLNNFAGKIGTKSIVTIGISTCEEIITPYIPPYSSGNTSGGTSGGTSGIGSGGGGGSYGSSNSSGVGSPGGSGTGFGGGSGGGGCTTIVASFGCDGCNRSYGSFEAFWNSSTCGGGAYGLVITISYSTSFTNCRLNEDCIPDGQIGVLPVDNENKPCETMTKITNDSAYMDRFDNLNKQDKFDLNHETGFSQTFNNFGALIYQNCLINGESSMIVPDNAVNYTHVHQDKIVVNGV